MSRYCCNSSSFFFLSVISLVAGAGVYTVVRTLPARVQENNTSSISEVVAVSDQDAIATFGAGCFWCVEGVFQELKGVKSVESGYMGGTVKNPTYKQVTTGRTGHAEVCRIVYDPETISFQKLLEVFWKTHDPTTLNRQGPDRGTQYRSAIFYHDEEQQKLAEAYKKKLDESGAFNAPIVTEITAASEYYPAENYHQDFFTNNPGNPYCQMWLVPKLEKFRKVFADDLKEKVSR